MRLLLFLNHGTRPTSTYLTTGGLAAKREALFYYSGTSVFLMTVEIEDAND
jgi:hypothetical protein